MMVEPETVQVPPRPSAWFRVNRGFFYHFFYEGEPISICGHSDRYGYPEDYVHPIPPGALLGDKCKHCRRMTEPPPVRGRR